MNKRLRNVDSDYVRIPEIARSMFKLQPRVLVEDKDRRKAPSNVFGRFVSIPDTDERLSSNELWPWECMNVDILENCVVGFERAANGREGIVIIADNVRAK